MREERITHLPRNNHGNRLTHALGSMKLVKPEDFTLRSITASLWHDAQSTLQNKITYKVFMQNITQYASPILCDHIEPTHNFFRFTTLPQTS